jgi:hypothetical protein
MDMSKLPRMSQTSAPPAAQAVAPEEEGRDTRDVVVAGYRQEQVDYGAEPSSSFAEVWISITVALILFFISTAPRLVQYVFSRSSFTWTFNDASGAPITYPQTVYFWGDVAVLSFCLTLIFEGLVLGLARKPALVAAAFAFTVAATALNFLYCASMMSNGYGFQIYSALAVAFGVYIAIYEWKLLQTLRMTRTQQQAR